MKMFSSHCKIPQFNLLFPMTLLQMLSPGSREAVELVLRRKNCWWYTTKPSKLCKTQILRLWVEKVLWKCSVENLVGKVLVEILVGNAIFYILEPPAFKKYSIQWVSEALCICLCLCLFFVSLRLGHCHHQILSFQKIYGLYGLEHHTVEING